MFNAADLDAALRARDEGRSLQLLAGLRSYQSFGWDLLIRIPEFWEQSDRVAQSAYDLALSLGDRGVELTAFAQASLRKLRGGGTALGLRLARRFLQRGLARWRSKPGWVPVDWRPYASDLVELLKGERRALAMGLLRLALEHDGERFASGLSTSLFIRWTELPEEVHAELARELEPLAPGLLKRSERKQPERTPLSAAEVIERLADAEPPYVMATGNVSPEPGRATRCLFYRISGQDLAPLDEMWVKDSALPGVLERLRARGPTWQASCDAMYATAAERIWINEPFTYWEDLKRRIWREGDVLFCGSERIPVPDLLFVEAYLEQGWVLRGVRLWMRKDGAARSLKLAEVEDHISEIDPTYDGINISLETEWAVTMAGALSRALGIPLKKDEAMF
jgi:hypothetical protein